MTTDNIEDENIEDENIEDAEVDKDLEIAKLLKVKANLEKDNAKYRARLAAAREAEDVDGVKKTEAANSKEKLNLALVKAALLAGASNPEQVAALVGDNVRINDAGEVEVIGGDGEPTGETLSEFVGDWLGDNRHFLAATITPGSGSPAKTFADSGRTPAQRGGLTWKELNDPKFYAENYQLINSWTNDGTLEQRIQGGIPQGAGTPSPLPGHELPISPPVLPSGLI